jgi:hypothetical protein
MEIAQQNLFATINNFISDHFTVRINDNFNQYNYNEINVMLGDFDDLFHTQYNPDQDNQPEMNNLINSIKIELDQLNFESIHEMIRITNTLYATHFANGQLYYLDIDADTLIKTYVYLYLYVNNFSQERERLMNTWELPNNNNIPQ